MLEKFKEILDNILNNKSYYDMESANKQARKRFRRIKQQENCEFYNKSQRWWRKYQSIIVEGKSKEEFEEAERIRHENIKYVSHRHSDRFFRNLV